MQRWQLSFKFYFFVTSKSTRDSEVYTYSIASKHISHLIYNDSHSNFIAAKTFYIHLKHVFSWTSVSWRNCVIVLYIKVNTNVKHLFFRIINGLCYLANISTDLLKMFEWYFSLASISSIQHFQRNDSICYKTTPNLLITSS